MTTKLTLTIEQKVIVPAKKYAQKKGKSLSKLVENYLRTLSVPAANESFSPKVKKLMGSVKLPKDFDYKQELIKALSKKQKK